MIPLQKSMRNLLPIIATSNGAGMLSRWRTSNYITIMRNLKGVFLCSIMMLRLIASAQPGTITIKREYVLALIADVERLNICDSLVANLSKEIDITDSLLNIQGARIELLEQQAELNRNDINTWAVRHDLLKEDTKYRLKQSRLKTLKITLVAIGEAVVIVLLIL